MKYPNPWTTASIQDRVAALGPDNARIYDYFSAFTHANPGYHVYLAENYLGEGLRFNTLKAALVHMIELLTMMAGQGVNVDMREIFRINGELFRLNVVSTVTHKNSPSLDL